jgi:uncharacterized membrane-anchored protein
MAKEIQNRFILSFSKKIERFRRILIIGTEERAVSLAHNIEKHKDLGLQILGFLSLFGGVKTFFTNGGLGVSIALMIFAVVLIMTASYYRIKEKMLKRKD